MTQCWPQGGRLNINMSSYQYRILIKKIRRSGDRLIFIMEITIPGKTVFILRRGPVPWPISTPQEICIRFPLCYVLLGLGTKISKEFIDKIFPIILPFFLLSYYFCHILCGINKNVGFRVDCIKESPHGKTIIVCQVIRWMNAFRAVYKRNTVVVMVTTICPLTQSRPIQNYRNFAGDTCKSILLIENLMAQLTIWQHWYR